MSTDTIMAPTGGSGAKKTAMRGPGPSPSQSSVTEMAATTTSAASPSDRTAVGATALISASGVHISNARGNAYLARGAAAGCKHRRDDNQSGSKKNDLIDMAVHRSNLLMLFLLSLSWRVKLGAIPGFIVVFVMVEPRGLIIRPRRVNVYKGRIARCRGGYYPLKFLYSG